MRRLIVRIFPLCILAATASVTGADGASADAIAIANAQVQASAALSQAGEGRRLFLKLNCYGCHGMAAEGSAGPRIARAELEEVSEALLKGKEGGMRSFSTYVTSTDITNIALYLRSIGTSSEPKFNDWWVPVPTK